MSVLLNYIPSKVKGSYSSRPDFSGYEGVSGAISWNKVFLPIQSLPVCLYLPYNLEGFGICLKSFSWPSQMHLFCRAGLTKGLLVFKHSGLLRWWVQECRQKKTPHLNSRLKDQSLFVFLWSLLQSQLLLPLTSPLESSCIFSVPALESIIAPKHYPPLMGEQFCAVWDVCAGCACCCWDFAASDLCEPA